MILNDILSGATPEPTPDNCAEILEKCKRMWREAYMTGEAARNESLRDGRYYHGPGQLDSKVREKLAKRGQPAIYHNVIQTAVQDCLGVLDQNETSPEAEPRNEGDEDAATVVTQILRYLSQRTDLPEVLRNVSANTLVYGIGATITEVDSNDNAKVSWIPYDQFFFDPCSMRHDFSDASYLIRAKWMDATAAIRLFPQYRDELRSAVTPTGAMFGPRDIAERLNMWIDYERRRLMIIECYYRDDTSGDWMRAVFCHTLLLLHGPTGFLDDNGKNVCPIEATSYEVDENNCRYGMVRNMTPIQNSINGRYSRMAHLTNSTRIRQIEQAVTTSSTIAKTEAASVNGCIPYGYQEADMTVDFQWNMALLNNDIALIAKMSPNPALIGRAGGANTSGKAHQIMASAGMTSHARAFARFERLEQRIYTQMWWRARQFMSDAQMIKITDDAGVRQTLQINQPIAGPVQQPVIGPGGQPVINPMTQQPQMQTVIGTVGYKHRLVEMDMDITVDTVVSSPSMRQEALDRLFDMLARAGIPVTSPDVEFLIEISEISNKKWLLQKWKSVKAQADAQAQQAAAPQQQMQAQQQQIQAALTQSKIAQHQAQASKDEAMAQKHAEETRLMVPDTIMKEAMLREAAGSPHGLLSIANASLD